MARQCKVEGCPKLTNRTRCAIHESEQQRKRNADPRRIERYKGEWPAVRKRVLAAHPYCAICGTTRDLTVDHDPRGGYNVWCRPCHARQEGARRRGAVL